MADYTSILPVELFSRANPLYVQAISTLLPPDTPETKSVVDPVDRCQGESRCTRQRNLIFLKS
jgi:hypothetical protein